MLTISTPAGHGGRLPELRRRDALLLRRHPRHREPRRGRQLPLQVQLVQLGAHDRPKDAPRVVQARCRVNRRAPAPPPPPRFVSPPRRPFPFLPHARAEASFGGVSGVWRDAWPPSAAEVRRIPRQPDDQTAMRPTIHRQSVTVTVHVAQRTRRWRPCHDGAARGWVCVPCLCGARPLCCGVQGGNSPV